jgi:probable phosphoglycerate mutase
MTAAPLARATELAVHTDPLLIEIDHGTWQGRLRDEIAANDGARYRTWRERPEEATFADGESTSDVLRRWKRFVAAFEPATPTLVVTHDVVVRLAILERTGRPPSDLWKPRVRNGGFAVFEVNAAHWELLDECVSGHLGVLDNDTANQAL